MVDRYATLLVAADRGRLLEVALCQRALSCPP